MKLIKLPVKVLMLPVIGVLFLFCNAGKVINRLSCYVIGPFMLFLLLLIVYRAFFKDWNDCRMLAGAELVCLALVFGVTWLICQAEDLNGHLIRFVCS